MFRPKRSAAILAAILSLTTAIPAHAWNYAGHRAIASIAYRQLDEPTRQKVADILKDHPAYADDWTKRETNGKDEKLNLFWNASVFPDDARREPYRKYGRSPAHYVNFRILTTDGIKVEPPLKGENVINSYVAHLRRIGEAKTSPEDRALHLSWVFHQAGDIHMPLHAVARFSKALPQGDKGGNGVTVPNPRARGNRPSNLHAYWDDLLGTDLSPAAEEKLADELIAEYPREMFAEELKKTNIEHWAKESVDVCLKVVYRDLDPEITHFAELPVAYEADATRAARKRAALAGYRLGDELKRLFEKNQ